MIDHVGDIALADMGYGSREWRVHVEAMITSAENVQGVHEWAESGGIRSRRTHPGRHLAQSGAHQRGGGPNSGGHTGRTSQYPLGRNPRFSKPLGSRVSGHRRCDGLDLDREHRRGIVAGPANRVERDWQGPLSGWRSESPQETSRPLFTKRRRARTSPPRSTNP